MLTPRMSPGLDKVFLFRQTGKVRSEIEWLAADGA